LYVTHVLELVEDNDPKLEDYLVFQEFKDVFLDEVLGLPPKRNIDFSIDLVPRVAPISKAPYRMITPKLMHLKMQFQ
jgi:hypothetical protein